MAGRAIAIFAVLHVAAYAQTGSVKGLLVDPSGAVVPFVEVVLHVKGVATPEQTTRTDAKGHFSFASVPPGAYELLVSARGFDRYSESIKVLEGHDTEVPTISLVLGQIAKCGPGPLGPPTIYSESVKPGEAEIYGTVAGVSGEFIARVQVSLRTINKNGHSATLVTDPDGSFYFSGIAPGIYTLRATRPGYSDFVIDRLEANDGQRTHIFEPLELLDCLKEFGCKPNREIHTVALCL